MSTLEQLPLTLPNIEPESYQPEAKDTTEEAETEYLVVSDTTSEVILSSSDLGECRKLATKVRKCGGQVTIFKSLKF